MGSLHVCALACDSPWGLTQSGERADKSPIGNLKLIEEQIDEYNESPLHWGYLASELMNANRKREGYRALREGVGCGEGIH